MSTGSGFTPPGAVECAYSPNMTRAQALALRAAGGLLPNCVVIIPGPTIGTAGNTSPTEIELNPTGPSELGLTARVHTAFDDSAWAGLYDIDLGLAGTIIRLADNRGNVVSDIDSGGATVHTQFPWGNANFRDNVVEDSTLTGWGTQVGVVSGNRVTDSTLDFTAKTLGTVLDTEYHGHTATISGVYNSNRARFVGGTTTKAGTGSFTFTSAEFLNQTINQIAGSSASLLMQECFQTLGSVTMDPTSAGAITVLQGVNGQLGIVHRGTGGMQFAAITGFLTATSSAASTRSLSVVGVVSERGRVNQNGVGNTNIDGVNGCDIMGDSTININHTLPGTGSSTIGRVSMNNNSVLNIADPSGLPSIANQCEISVQSTMNIQPGGSASRCRISGESTFNTGAFSAIASVIEGQITKTAGAGNVNKLANKSYDDWS